MLYRCQDSPGGRVDVPGYELMCASTLHTRGLGTFYPAERVFVINEAGRRAAPLHTKPSKVQPCSFPGCTRRGTSAVSHAPVCREHATQELRRRLGKPLPREIPHDVLLDTLNSSTSMLTASKRLGLCISTLQTKASKHADTREALKACCERGKKMRGTGHHPKRKRKVEP